MRYILITIVIVFCTAMLISFNNSVKNPDYDVELLMKNDFFVSGTVLDIKVSNNHNFGILLLRIESLHMGKFNGQTVVDAAVYPYRIRGDNVEIYTTIPNSIKMGDRLIVDSNKSKLFYWRHTLQEKTGVYLALVTDPDEMEYITKNTTFIK